MSVEQLINFLVVFGISGYSIFEDKSHSSIVEVKLIALGLCFILAQHVLNIAFGGDMRGIPITLRDVLLLKGISFNFGIAFIGYVFFFIGLFGVLKRVAQKIFGGT